MGGLALIGKAVIVVLMMSNSPQDDHAEVFTSVGVVESMGDNTAVLAACETHGLSLLKEFPDVVLGYSCETLREGKDL